MVGWLAGPLAGGLGGLLGGWLASVSGPQLHFLTSRALAATFEIQMGRIWSHFGRPMLFHIWLILLAGNWRRVILSRHDNLLPKLVSFFRTDAATTRLASVAPIQTCFRPILQGDTCWHESTSKMSSLQQKVDIELKDARVRWRLEGVKHRLPSSESASKRRTLTQKVDVELKDAHVG